MKKQRIGLVSIWLLCFLSAPALAADAIQPSFNCKLRQAQDGAVKNWICDNAALARLDHRLASTYERAQRKTALEDLPLLHRNQYAWAEQRDACLVDKQPERCARRHYRQRIATLQARYQLVPSQGPFTYVCDDVPTSWVVAHYFNSDPKVVRAKRGDEEALMFQVEGASGKQYRDDEHQLWWQGDKLLLRWGKQASRIRCYQRFDPLQ
ncbi:MliC family protein [Shewanella sp. YIC-542]|uniref:MliC family protein n=1 Tax=Shewanella mytili TaxID=3377111 RepID=UPI00398E74A7